MTTAAVILAAGAASRFGGGKLRASVGGRPLVGRVADTARAAGLQPIVVVVAPDDDLDDLDLGDVRRVVNPHPEEGLGSSVRVGLRAVEHDDGVEAALLLPGDQPLVRVETIRAILAAAAARPDTPFLVARHAADAAPNPVLARRATWRLADELAGDRGFGPVLASHPELVGWVDVEGSNPDVDTPADLQRLERSSTKS
jgi:molybdenum cofactor cytidylyltransferase